MTTPDRPPGLLPPDVPADGQVHMRLELVPVYAVRCPRCGIGSGFPAFWLRLGAEQAVSWLYDHQTRHCPKRHRPKGETA